MFSWLKIILFDTKVSENEEEMKIFIQILRGMDDTALGGLVVGANWTRKTLEQHGQIPKGLLTKGPVMDSFNCMLSSIDISKAIKNHQKEGNNILASFLMVWMHSLRALSTFELTLLGQEMWQELQRGFPYIENGYNTVKILSLDLGLVIEEGIKQEALFIPTGLKKANFSFF
jgi:hypothetical protein